MKFFIKSDGTLVEATQEQVLDPGVILFNEEGEKLRSAPPVTDTTDHVKELTNVVKEMNDNIANRSSYDKELADMRLKMEAYDKAMKRGFPMPGKEVLEANTMEDLESIVAPYELAKQGRALQEKAKFVQNREISESDRQELAKFYCLFLKASVLGDPFAKMTFNEVYKETRARFKANSTDLGDSGNVFPVPDIVESEILAFAREASVVLQEARIWPMTSDTLSIPTEGDAVTAVWSNTTGEDTPNISETEISATELSIYAAVKNATLADSRSDIVSWIGEVMATACGQAIDTAGFSGTGSPCSGIFLTAGYSVVMATTSTNFSSITAGHLSDMISKLDGVKKQNAKFYMHGMILHYIRNLTDDNGRPIFIETMGAPMSGTIWGYPYREVVVAPSTSATSTSFVAFGDMRCLAVGRRLDTTALQVDPYGLWTTNRTRFKIYQRWGMELALTEGFAKLVTAGS